MRLNKKKVAVIGHFGFGKELFNGQTVKTKIVTKELENVFGEESVLKFDTHGGIKTLFKLPGQIFRALNNAQNIVIFPAHKGVRIITPILLFENLVFKRSIHYIVIGGWLPLFLRGKSILRFLLRKFDGIYVETITMKNALVEMGYTNIFVMPNCKELKILDKSELIYSSKEPFKLCTFSRVMKEKGIEDAIEAVKTVNIQLGRTVYTLDIYGQVDSNQSEWFEELQKQFPTYIRYGGIVSYEKSVDVLKQYFALLFPTFYDGEGFAGTALDAYASGLPVIASDWKYNSEIIKDGYLGRIFKTHDLKEFVEALLLIHEKYDEWNQLKENCLLVANEYTPQSVVAVLVKELRSSESG